MADWLHRNRRFPQYVTPFLDAEIGGGRLVKMLPKSADNAAKWLALGVSAPHQLQARPRDLW